MSTDVLIFGLKVMAIQGLAYLVYRFLLESTAGLGTFNRWYLLIAPLAACVPPLLVVRERIVVGDAAAPIQAKVATPNVSDTFLKMPANESGVDWAVLIFIVYALGTLVGLYKLWRAYRVIACQKRRAIRVTRESGVCWYGLDCPVAPHTFGKAIFYTIGREPMPAIRAHELFHARQGHSADRIYIALLRAVWWFNPLLWLYERSVIYNHEVLADRGAMRRERLSPTNYQRALLASLSGHPGGGALASNLSYSFTKKRFVMIRSSHTLPTRLLRSFVATAVWLPLLLVFGRTAYAQETPPPPPPPPLAVTPTTIPAYDKKAIGDSIPLPPPPPPTADIDLDLTVGEYYDRYRQEYQEKYPGRSDIMYRLRPEKREKTFREIRLERKRNDLNWVQNMQPISEADLADYLNADKYGVWLDKNRIDNAALRDYGADNLYLPAPPSRLAANAKHYGQYTYHLELRSEAWRQEKLKKLPREIAELEGGR